MENPMQIMFFNKINGAAAIRFEMTGQDRYALSFCSQGKVTLYIPDKFQDKLMRCGLSLIVSKELRIDFLCLKIEPLATFDSAAMPDSQQMVVLIKELRALCYCTNLYFTERAAFYWKILPGDCNVEDMHVRTSKCKIAYRQLIEIDAELYYGSRNVA
jgi:hypothetical protein